MSSQQFQSNGIEKLRNDALILCNSKLRLHQWGQTCLMYLYGEICLMSASGQNSELQRIDASS